MKICNKCIEQNEDAANFCQRCRASFESAGTATCPRGHIIDPTWAECPYCRAEQSSPDIGMMASVGSEGEGGMRRKETMVEQRPQTVEERPFGIGAPPPLPAPPPMPPP